MLVGQALQTGGVGPGTVGGVAAAAVAAAAVIPAAAIAAMAGGAGEVAAGGIVEKRHRLGGAGGTEHRRSRQQGAAQARIDGQLGKDLAQVGDAGGGLHLDRPERGQRRVGVGDVAGRGSVGKWQAHRAGRAPRRDVEHGAGQIGDGDLRSGPGVEARPLRFADAAHGQAGAEAGGAARALFGR